MTYHSKPPTLRVTDPDDMWIRCELRLLGWAAMRRLARCADCTLTEERIGLITKRFTVRGNAYELQNFVSAAWNDADLGPSFRKEIEAIAS